MSAALGVTVVTSIAVRKGGIAELLRRTDEFAAHLGENKRDNTWMPLSIAELKATQREADRIIRETVTMPSKPDTLTTRVDAVVLHPVFGLVILGLILPTQVRTLQVTPR
jgi:ferrous iron transport protein B